jgi:hypothetical protein
MNSLQHMQGRQRTAARLCQIAPKASVKRIQTPESSVSLSRNFPVEGDQAIIVDLTVKAK